MRRIKELVEKLDRAIEQFLNPEKEGDDRPSTSGKSSAEMIKETNDFLSANLPTTEQTASSVR